MKKYLLAVLSVFLLVGGVFISACSNSAPQAVINVSSSDFVSEDYIEIDLNSDRPYAQVTASVENVSSGRVSANNNSESILQASAAYNSDANNTLITITGVSEGLGYVELRSEEGDGTRLITVYVYSDILGMSQKADEVGQASDQYVVRSQQGENLVNILDSERYLTFLSRENGESNRKDVTWAFSQNQQNNLTGLILEANSLVVQNGYIGDTVELVASSVYTDYSATVQLHVLSQLSEPTLQFSRSANSNFGDYNSSFETLVKNDQSKAESALYVSLSVEASEGIEVLPVVLDRFGNNVTNALTIRRINESSSGGLIQRTYVVEAASAGLDPQTLTVYFEVSYQSYNYSQNSQQFQVSLVDVVDSINITTDGQTVTNGDTFDVYNNYNNTDGSGNYGRPFVVNLGPDTVANDQATFAIRMRENPNGRFLIYVSNSNSSYYIQENFTPVLIDGITYYQSQPIANGSVVYFRASGTFGSGDETDVAFYSTQSENVALNFKLRSYFAPSSNFNFSNNVTLDYHISTQTLNSVTISFTLDEVQLADIASGLYLDPTDGAGNPNTDFEVSELTIVGETGTFTVSNLETNLTGSSLTIALRHRNGFYATANFTVQAFVPLSDAVLSYQGNSTNAVAASGNAYQTSGGIESFTLNRLVMTSTNSLVLNVRTNTNATLSSPYAFAFYKTDEELDGSILDQLQESMRDNASVTFDATTGRMTVNNDVKGYVVFTFDGFDQKHNQITVQRWFYLEGFTSPTSLRPNPQSLSLIARDSISTQDASLAQGSVRVTFRTDGNAITYYDESNFSFTSSTGASVNLLEKGYNYQITKISTTDQVLSFDVAANTTNGFKTFVDTLVVEYTVFGRTYYATIEINITNATRVEQVVWENQTSDGEIYIDLYATNSTDRQFTIISSTLPLSAYNDELTYIFVPDSGTSANLVSINELGIITPNSQTVGGTGTIFVLPSDAIRVVGGVAQIVYLSEVDGEVTSNSVPLSELSDRYDEIINGYFVSDRTAEDVTNVYYRDIILRIRLTVADGRSEETATRIYNAAQFAEIDPNMHYILMSSIELADWESFGAPLTGSLKGYDNNISISVTGQPIFNAIASTGKFENFTLSGEVNGGGFVANLNQGSIKNVTITVQSSTSSPSLLSGGYEFDGNLYAGAIVGINEGSIGAEDGEVRIEGVTVDIATGDNLSSYAGMFAGSNSGAIAYTYGEFYIFDQTESGNDVINTITAAYVGGFVGSLTGGSITHSYVFNYTFDENGTFTANALNAEVYSGAFAGAYSSGEISNSFAMVQDNINPGILTNISNSYWGVNDDTGDTDSEYWIGEGEEGFNSYVRNGEPHLRFYQSEALLDLSVIAVQPTSKSLPVNNGEEGILFLHRVQNSLGMSDSASTALTQLNTISFVELFGNASIVATSLNNNIAEVVGNNVLIKETGDLTLQITSKQDYTQSREINFKVVYVVEDFQATYGGIQSTGFDLQEGQTANIIFKIKNSVYLANETQPRTLRLEEMSLTDEVGIEDDNGETINFESEFVNYTVNGMVGTVSFGLGLTDELEKQNRTSVILTSKINLTDFADNDAYQTAIEQAFSQSLTVRPFQGANEILTNVDSMTINPSVTSKITVVLATDSSADSISLQLLRKVSPLTFGGANNGQTSFVYSDTNTSASIFYTQAILDMSISRSAYDETAQTYTYEITFKVAEDYRSQIAASENYTLVISSVSGTAKNEGREIDITLTRQDINYIDIANYEASNVSNINGNIVYTYQTNQVSVLSPGRSSFMVVNVDPSFAYYNYMTLTYSAVDTATNQPSSSILTMAKLNEFSGGGVNNGYVVDYSSNVSNDVINGLRVNRDDSGTYVFRLYPSPNIGSDTTFVITAAFYDANGNQIAQSVYELFVSYLPQAEILVDGQNSTILAKGGTAELSILLQQGQELDYLTATGATGVTISPKEAWQVEELSNGTVLYTAQLRASLNASVNGTNGTFEVTAQVSRYLNGETDRKTSTAYVTLVNFKPTSASLEGAAYNASNNTYMFDTYVGITNGLTFDYSFNPESYAYDASNQDEVEFANSLYEAREQFIQTGYYQDDETGFSINYYNGNAIPIYQRLEMNGTRLNFSQSGDGVYTYSNTRFRLTYTEERNDGNEITSAYLTVTGLTTTASPVYLTLVDEIRLDSDGSDVLYEIETNFAISVGIYSDQDRALPIRTAEEFLSVADEGQAADYILLNDITLTNYTPISSSNFRSLDGNGYTINIESFNLEGSGTLNLALFTTISADSVIKNVRVNYYQSQPITVDVTSTGYSNINIAGLAITNNGTVTNTQVVAYKTASTSFTNSGDIGIIVNYVRGSTPVYIDANSSISSQVAGFVITNSGSITNSKVGGEEIIIIGEQVADSDRFEYTTESLSTFTISAQGTVSGFVITNSGDIASSSASQVQITNLASSNQTQTAGFVITNSGDIRASAVQGVKRQGTGNDADTYHRTGSNISANGTVSGFAIRNTTTGVITDGYSNILISDRSTQNSLTSAGFIYQNEGYIETSYAASYVEKANIRQLSFSGVDSTGHSLNTGTIELSYYYIADYDDDTASDVEGTLDSANLISREEVENQNAYYGFIFNSTSSAGDGIWTLIEGEGVEPVSLSILTISHRYYVAGQDGEYFLPYSILTNSGDSFAPDYDTTYGEDINPILITSAQDFQEAMGASTSTSVGGQFNDTEIFGSYRFAADIDLSELNNDIGNAEVGSVDRIFSGQIDGNGFTINNISLSSSNNAVGLFAETRNALIQNLNIEINSITAGNSVVVGGLVGVAKDSRIINIQMSQRTTTSGDSEERGVHGRNVTGGIVGAAFGQSVLVGLSATDAIVQSGYYNNSTANDFEQAIYSRGDWAFNAQAVRTYAEANSSQLYAADGLGQTSFAGGLVGYLDIYTASQVLQTGYIYVTNLSNSDYSVSNLRVNNSIDVRAEIVGGLIGYTGPQTRVQDAGIYFTNQANTYANLLSYNFAAGGLVGLANGDFYQVFAQYEQTLQDEIESSTSQYYGGASTTERGLTDIFEGTANEVGAQSYQPQFVGGLFGVIGTGRVYIAYSKINAINPQNGGYAGGIAGGVYNASEFLIDDPASSSSQATIATTLLLNEVYASGDVYAEGVFNNVATHFGGLFGRFLTVGSTNVKLSMAAVNAVNEYGILGEGYYSESNPTGINEINALVGTMDDGASVFVYAVSASGQNLPDVSDIKSYGYMSSYTAGSLTVNVKSGVYKEAESGGYEDADYVFRIESVSSFTSPEDGFTDTNGAFINSNAWSSDNWIHETTKLYPDINLVNTISYIYLDQDNVDSVVARMQNSSIEVRVRGKSIDENGNVSYGYVDLIGYTIKNFTGRLVGAVDNSWFINSNFGAYTNDDENSTDIFSNNYPGIIVNGTLFETPLSGATFQNLNMVFDATTGDIEGPFVSGTNLQDLSFSDINAWFVDGVSITAEESGGNAYGGLFVSSATNTSFRNILLRFSATNTDSGNIVEFTTRTNNNDNIQYTDAAFGLLAGQLVQGSPFDALRVQNITIKHNVLGVNGPDADHALMRVEIGASVDVTNLYAGLYVGKIANADVGGQYAGVNITAKAPQSVSDDNTASFTSALGIGAGFSVTGTAYIGGFVGQISTSNTAFTFIKDQTYQQSINIYADFAAADMNIGGLFGDATLTSFSTNITVEGTQQLFDSNIRLTRDVTENLYAGLLAGNISSGANISLNPTSRYTISGSISAAITSSTTETDTTGISGNAHLGGLVGRNNANITVTNLVLFFEIYGTVNDESANENDFELEDTSKAFQAKAIDAGGLVGTNAGVLIIGEEQGVGESTGVSVNANGKNLRLQATGGELNAGGLVGNMTGGSATIQALSDNASIIWALGNTSGTTNVGGIIGDVTSGVSELSISNAQSDVNFFVSAKKVNAGGIIGHLNSAATIDSTVFSGSFKVFGGTSNLGDHKMGGVVGYVSGGSSSTIISNKTYGDVIYTYGSDFLSLNSYHFGGVVGDVDSGSVSLGANIVAFTNNNQARASGTHFADAMVGNGGFTQYTGISDITNYYSSQLVLATSDNAVDLNYNIEKGTTPVTGYSPNDEDYQALAQSIITKLFGKDVYGDSGTKFNPVKDGTTATTTDDTVNTTHGIQYYTTKYPNYIQGTAESTTESTTETTTTSPEEAYAFIGDWKEQTSALETLSQHSFVSGVYTNLDIQDANNTTRYGKNSGGIVNTMTGGIVYACISSGTLSVGGIEEVNLGGIVGLMTSGYINDCSSSLNIVYRAGKNELEKTGETEKTGGTASGIATSKQDNTKFNRIYVNNTYSTGKVTSYIDANLYSFTNGLAEDVQNSNNDHFYITNSYTISRVDWNDYTSEETSKGEGIDIGITGSAQCTSFAYDTNALGDAYGAGSGTGAITSDSWIYPASFEINDDSNNASSSSPEDSPLTMDNGWSKTNTINYGYPVRNFAQFKDFTTQTTIGTIIYQQIPNVTKLVQASDTEVNYILTNDIDFNETTYANSWTSLTFTNVKYFDGDGHTISNLKGGTLIDTVQNISNLRVTDAALEAQAVVALHVTENATNVIATGKLTVDGGTNFADVSDDSSGNARFKDKSVGGLFAIADGTISGCKNYVYIDVTKDGLDVGGIVGRAVGSITNCFNYSPINAVSAYADDSGGNVGGIVGGFAGESVSNCGNENTVFNGYTSNTSGNARYHAAGIVGNGYGTIENCYNTSMIKAGNKNINADTGEYSAAAGIATAFSGTINSCTNTGFIEALGSNTPNAKTAFSFGEDIYSDGSEDENENKQLTGTTKNDEDSTTTEDISYLINCNNIINVQVDPIGIGMNDQSSGNLNQGSIYKNGAFGSQSGSVSVTIPTYEPGWDGSSDNISVNDITISLASAPTAVVAETDELGAMTKFYVKSTRSIQYPGNVKREQQRYWEVVDINGYSDPYNDSIGSGVGNYYAQKATEITNAYNTGGSTLLTTSSNGSSADDSTIKEVKIGGGTYTFVQDATGFRTALQSSVNRQVVTIPLSTQLSADDETTGKSISDLIANGYTLSFIVYDEGGDEVEDVYNTQTTDENNLKITFYSAVSFNAIKSISISATKAPESENIYLLASNITLSDETVTIQTTLSGLTNEKAYTLIVNKGSYSFKWNNADKTLTYTGANAENAKSVYNALKNQTATINLSENVYTTVEPIEITELTANDKSTQIAGTYNGQIGGDGEYFTEIGTKLINGGDTNSEGENDSIDGKYILDREYNPQEDASGQFLQNMTMTINGLATGVTFDFADDSVSFSDNTVEKSYTISNGSISNSFTINYSDSSFLINFTVSHDTENNTTIFSWSNSSDNALFAMFSLGHTNAHFSYTPTAPDQSDVVVEERFEGDSLKETYNYSVCSKVTPINEVLVRDEVFNVTYDSVWVTYNIYDYEYELNSVQINVAEPDENAFDVTYIADSAEGRQEGQVLSNSADRTLSFENLNGKDLNLLKLQSNETSSIEHELGVSADKIEEGSLAVNIVTQDVIISESTAAVTGTYSGENNTQATFTIGGATYVLAIEDYEVVSINAATGGVHDSYITISDVNYVFGVDSDGNPILRSCFVGKNGQVNVDGNLINYIQTDSSTTATGYEFTTVDGVDVAQSVDASSGNMTVTIGGTIYYFNGYTETLKASNYTLGDDGKLTINYSIDSLNAANSLLRITYNRLNDATNVSFTINYHEIDLENRYKDEGDLISSITANGASIGDDKIIGPVNSDTQFNITRAYKSFEGEKLSSGITFGDRENAADNEISNIVLTKDIDLGYSSTITTSATRLTSTNGNIVTFRTTTSNGLMSGNSASMKNVSFAGSVGIDGGSTDDNTPGFGIISGGTLSGSLVNVSTYGTFYQNQAGGKHAGGVAHSISSTTLTNVKNYASFSHNTAHIERDGGENNRGNMAGIAWEITLVSSESSESTESTVSISVFNYGTIIGRNGSHGTSLQSSDSREGGNGQSVYAIASTITNSASNVTFTGSYNYGIVKAGDAGSGARGADAAATVKDTINNAAPDNGVTGGGAGGRGNVGTAYFIAATTSFNGTAARSANGGADGLGGNSSWGGVNLYKYEYTQTNTLNKSRAGDGYSSQDLTQWNVWHNGTVRDSNASNYTTIFTKFQYGEDAPSDSLRVLPLSDGSSNWVEIQFNKTLHVSISGGNYEHINCDRDWTECGPGQGMTDIDGVMQSDFHLNFVVKINGTMGAWNWRYMLGTQGNLAHIQLYCCEQPLGATITQQVI